MVAALGEDVIHILGGGGGRGQRKLPVGGTVRGGGDVTHGHILLAVRFPDLLYFRRVLCHRAGDGHQVALLFLVILIRKYVGAETAVVHGVIRPQQVGNVGVDLQLGDDGRAGVGVTLVLVQAAAAVLHLIDGAPDGGLLENAGVYAGYIAESQRVQHDHTEQAVLVGFAAVGIIQHAAQQADHPAKHGEKTNDSQQQRYAAYDLPCQTAVIADMFFFVICHFGLGAPLGE